MIEHWESALADLRERLSAENYETWLGAIRFDGFDGKRLRIRIPNRFYADWIRTHYLDLLLDSLRTRSSRSTTSRSTGRSTRALAEPDRRARTSAGPSRRRRRAPSEPPRPPTNLNPKYRFENFVVGPSNQLAHAAAMAAASSPGARYNPLFIYGGVGLGKTHLVNAVGHRVLRGQPERAHPVRVGRALHERVHLGAAEPPHQRVPRALPQRLRRAADGRHPVPGGPRADAGRVLPHVQRALSRRPQIVVTSDVYPQQIARDGRAADQPLPVGPGRRHPGARARHAHRDREEEGRARAHRRSPTTSRSSSRRRSRATCASSRARCCASRSRPSCSSAPIDLEFAQGGAARRAAQVRDRDHGRGHPARGLRLLQHPHGRPEVAPAPPRGRASRA